MTYEQRCAECPGCKLEHRLIYGLKGQKYHDDGRMRYITDSDDEHADHYYRCTAPTREQFEREQTARIEELEADRREVLRLIAESNIRCGCPSDDGSDDCANIDNCLYHSLLLHCSPKEATDGK